MTGQVFRSGVIILLYINFLILHVIVLDMNHSCVSRNELTFLHNSWLKEVVTHIKMVASHLQVLVPQFILFTLINTKLNTLRNFSYLFVLSVFYVILFKIS